jgi:SRSO17 transposase
MQLPAFLTSAIRRRTAAQYRGLPQAPDDSHAAAPIPHRAVPTSKDWRGLLAPLERRNGWTIAEHAGRRSPNAVQEMLYSPCWDPHLVRDDVRGHVVEHLGDPAGVLIADDTGFATKPQQARAMIERAVAAGVPFAWFTADEAFGQNRGLRGWLEQQDIGYVMATRNDDEVPAGLHTVSPVKD